MKPRFVSLVLLLITIFAALASAQPTATPGVLHAPSAPAFDVKAATDAYLAKVPADQRARSDAYFEGGYWLQLWDFLITIAILGAMLHWGISARMRDLAERITRFRPLQVAVYAIQFILLVAIVQFPWTIYEGFVREHKYGLSNQTFGAWFRDQAVGLAVSLVLGTLFLMLLFGLVRRLGRNWWIWGLPPLSGLWHSSS
jgi:STE24 endopeptidase